MASSNSESKIEIRNWSYGVIFACLGFIGLLHAHITGLLPEKARELSVLNESILPMSWNLRYMIRGLFIFACAYGSMSTSVVFRQINPHGIWFFVLGAAMLLYGYMPSLDWYNAFVFPLTPFIVMFNAKHLPVLGFKRKRREDYYNNYPRNDKPGSIRFPLQKERLKSVVEEKANFSKPLILSEPDETTIIEAGTGKGKSRGCISHFIESCIRNEWNVVIHDFKGNPWDPSHPELTKFALDAIRRNRKDYELNVIGFTDAPYTKRCNIYDPYAVKTEQDIRGVNQSLLYSLNKSWAKDSANSDPFWKDNAISLTNGMTLTMKAFRPEILTLPHLVAIGVRDTDDIIDAFMNVQDPYLRMYFQAFRNAYNQAKETSGSIISSTQIPLVNLNDLNMFWALSGNEDMGENYFKLDFNGKRPFILSVCNNANQPIHTHGVNTYLKTILARLNTSTNRPTVLVIDEFDQTYVDGIDRSIATVRSAGTKIVIVLQTYNQLVDRLGKSYADKIVDLGQNKIYGGGSSPESVKKFVDSYVAKYQDLEFNMSQTGSSDDSAGVRTADKKIVEVPDVLGQEKFHFSGVMSTGDPNTFFNLPFKVNELDMKSISLPMMNKDFIAKYEQFREMTKITSEGNELKVSEEEAQASFNAYVQEALIENRKRIFKEADEFIDDLKHGTI